jgi:hypothetical protein
MEWRAMNLERNWMDFDDLFIWVPLIGVKYQMDKAHFARLF